MEDKISRCSWHDIATISSSLSSVSIWSLSLATVVTAPTMAILEVAQQASLITQSLLVTIDIDITTRYVCQPVVGGSLNQLLLTVSCRFLNNRFVTMNAEIYLDNFYLLQFKVDCSPCV